ncbi:MAG: SIR2 family protein, partial [Pseudomonadota bacterium]
MTITDQSHINRIREALWHSPESGASIMIGAGFSRNAKKAGPHSSEFPLWQDITAELCRKLYPPGDKKLFEWALKESSGTSGFLRLAQEYEAAFGRGNLNSLLKMIVPDDDYAPDEIHLRLLRLPWRDVFTTNWDSLLERTQPLIPERKYCVVRTQDEIPSATMPRIFKLHGSFPAHTPFIVTEEDYRTYPKLFSPYVNTVQQSMMETVFCLIGFSGDDPNFLHWSGWVRDNLGKLAPKIYIAGWLELSPHRRRMLEERNVVPIDVSFHPNASKWPEHLRHRYATEWILHTLENGQPYDITEWPTPPDRHKSVIPDLLLPVENVVADAPVEVSMPLNKDKISASLVDQVRSAMKDWKYNREIYPGWLFIPPDKRFLIESSMQEWEPVVLQALPEFSLIEQLFMIRELVWRREYLLEPLSEDLEHAAEAILSQIDCQNRTINAVEDQSIIWADVREAWRELGMSLITMARQRFDRELFDSRLDAISPFLNDNPEVTQRIQHEKCIRALNDFEFLTLKDLLKKWVLENCDPAWMARKAAILVEIGRNDEGIRLLNKSLTIVREGQSSRRPLASSSREGWILWLAIAFQHDFLRKTDEILKAQPAFKRWKELSNLQCDAFQQKQTFLSELKGDPEKEDAPLFDFGVRRGRTICYSNTEHDKRISARRSIRLTEVAGLPPCISHMVVSSDLLSLAALNLKDENGPLSVRLALRVATSESDRTLNLVLTRSRVAAMPKEDVVKIVELITNAIPYVLSEFGRESRESDIWVSRLRVLLEALSRLVLRLSKDHAKTIFLQALSYYGMKNIAIHPWLGTSIDHLLTRTWETLPKSIRTDMVLDILSAPIVGNDGFEAFHNYPDPGKLLIDNEDIPNISRLPELDGRWSGIVNLISHGLKGKIDTREKAAFRVVPLVFWDILAESEKELIAKSLWDPI